MSTTILSSAEDVINLALVRAGSKARIGSIYEGSMIAKKALDIYSQSRDQLISGGQWEFAERLINATLLKTAPVGGYGPWQVWTPAFPAVPWLYSYSYPSDCLKLRSVRAAPLQIPNFDPQHNIYSTDNDNSYTPPVKVVLCNVPNAIFTYAAQVTDPTTWSPSFIEALAANLARRLSPVIGGLEAEKIEAQDEQVADNMAESEKG